MSYQKKFETPGEVMGVSGSCKVVRPGSGCGHLVMCATSC